MRKIDADELITAFPMGETIRTESVRETIRHMPTIPDNKQGFWRKGYLGYNCSECGCHVQRERNYCPDCGVQMVEPTIEEESMLTINNIFKNFKYTMPALN